jgi:colicin import membrane protein
MTRSNGAAKKNPQAKNNCETSAIVSIEALLRAHEEDVAQAERDAELERAREMEARAEADREAERVLEAQRISAERETEAKRLAAERHAAEIAALKEAAIKRAEMEAALAQRHAHEDSEREHQRKLAAIAHDASKARLKRGVIASVVLLLMAIVGSGVAVHVQHTREVAAQEQAKQLAAKLDELQGSISDLQREKATASDPAKIAALEKRIADQQAELDRMKPPPGTTPTIKPTVRSTGIAVPASTSTATQQAKQCFCYEGDPSCDWTVCKPIKRNK